MTSRFKDKLKAIRDASAQKSAEDFEARSQENLLKTERTVASFEYRERVERKIEEFVKNFQQEAPDFALNRGFFEGKYMLSLRVTEGPAEDGERAFSRLMFLMAPRPAEGRFGLQCRKTIRNRDLESASLDEAMDKSGLRALARFVEAQFLEFAERYFGTNAHSEPEPVEG